MHHDIGKAKFKPNGETSPWSQEPSEAFCNVVYYPGPATHRHTPPKFLDVAVASHLIFTAATVDYDGTVRLNQDPKSSSLDGNTIENDLRACVALKQTRPHLRVLVSIKGSANGQAFRYVAAEKWLRYRFARSARSLVERYGLDGIEIDWDHPTNPSEGTNYIRLVATVRGFLEEPMHTLFLALSNAESIPKWVDFKQVSFLLDYISVRFFDLRTSNHVDGVKSFALSLASQRSHTSNVPPSCYSAVEYLGSMGVPRSKILLGVLGSDSSTFGAVDHKDALPGIQAFDQSASLDPEKTPGAVQYDNSTSLAIKARFVKEKRLGGLSYWGCTDATSTLFSLISRGFFELTCDAKRPVPTSVSTPSTHQAQKPSAVSPSESALHPRLFLSSDRRIAPLSTLKSSTTRPRSFFSDPHYTSDATQHPGKRVRMH